MHIELIFVSKFIPHESRKINQRTSMYAPLIFTRFNETPKSWWISKVRPICETIFQKEKNTHSDILIDITKPLVGSDKKKVWKKRAQQLETILYDKWPHNSIATRKIAVRAAKPMSRAPACIFRTQRAKSIITGSIRRPNVHVQGDNA